MHITAIIAEYNPFHNGHLYQLSKIKKDLESNYVVSIISGNFTQRGLPTIIDKFHRTRMALASGIDMVIELPTIYATASAEFFARGAISILDKCNIVSALCFGAESPDLQIFKQISELLLDEPSGYKTHLNNLLKSGYSYPSARSHAICKHFNNPSLEHFISSPNNILGIEYLKALQYYFSPILPISIQREITNYKDKTIYSNLASASAIRKALEINEIEQLANAMPKECLQILLEHKYPDINKLYDLVCYKLMTGPKSEIYSTFDVPANLINSIYNSLGQVTTYRMLAEKLTSKTYSKATVYRSLLKIILGIYPDKYDGDYVRVLGIRESSKNLLSLLYKQSRIPVITNAKAATSSRFSDKQLNSLNTDILATNLYSILNGDNSLYNADFNKKFIIYPS
ncbi:hypothetical protein AN643_00195 [Candidatus Epulonipiscioides saccharophilum]|nr:hypothetical protein AN643_00195 [Epulopiscium sp. SCG-B10WGA-EpuloB]